MSQVRDGGDLLELADAVLTRVPPGSEAEVTVTNTAAALTRYANGGIHQSVADESLRLRLRLIRDGRCGVAAVQAAGDGAAAVLVETAEALRQRSPQGEPVPLYEPDGGADSDAGYSAVTAAATPEQRADVVAEVCATAAALGQQAYGAYETAVSTVAMVSTTGLRRSGRRSLAELLSVCRGADGSGYAARHHADLAAIDAAAVATEVTERCARNQGARAIEPGRYAVILSPYAVAEMIEYLGLMGLGGLATLEERSFMRFGERLMSPQVTISDDGTLAALAPLAFDGEGASVRGVTLIEAGVCRAVVHDSVTAARCGTISTGHSSAQPNTDGPLPHHLCLAPGGDDPASLVASCERGLLVTRFWYVRPVHPLATVITGMTRDGTFLVEDGRVVRPVRDLRFTQGIVEALADVRGVSAERLAVRGYVGATLAPWLHLGGFTFSS